MPALTVRGTPEKTVAPGRAELARGARAQVAPASAAAAAWTPAPARAAAVARTQLPAAAEPMLIPRRDPIARPTWLRITRPTRRRRMPRRSTATVLTAGRAATARMRPSRRPARTRTPARLRLVPTAVRTLATPPTRGRKPADPTIEAIDRASERVERELGAERLRPRGVGLLGAERLANEIGRHAGRRQAGRSCGPGVRAPRPRRGLREPHPHVGVEADAVHEVVDGLAQPAAEAFVI